MSANSVLLRPVGAASCLAVVLLSGCSSTASVEPATGADAPECAEAMLHLPEEIGDLERRPTDSQATAVWGDPAAVTLRCGVEPPGPTEEVCTTRYGVDWLQIPDEETIDEESRGVWQLVTYGRVPALEVYADLDRVADSTLTEALAAPAHSIEQTRECLAVDDVLDDAGE